MEKTAIYIKLTSNDAGNRAELKKSHNEQNEWAVRQRDCPFLEEIESESDNIMFEIFFTELKEYAENITHIESVIVVGSYARGTNKENSDLDIVIITSNKSDMIENQEFTKEFGEVYKQQVEYYGACTSIRVWYEDGKEVEFGIVEPSWISIPLDMGTYQVLSDGYKVIVDKKQYFENLQL